MYNVGDVLIAKANHIGTFTQGKFYQVLRRTIEDDNRPSIWLRSDGGMEFYLHDRYVGDYLYLYKAYERFAPKTEIEWLDRIQENFKDG